MAYAFSCHLPVAFCFTFIVTACLQVKNKLRLAV
jgi:hypothetical protein